ncbi:STE-domain-containing protein [Panus rudis PR-1116 ss-1]|nr:STE-domain-containing protein [Panus rudis PR-1116 ss-1]
MDTLVAHPHHYSMNAMPYSSHVSLPSSSTQHRQLDYQYGQSQYSQLDPRSAVVRQGSSLHISTTADMPRDHDPEEETAHPSRQPPLSISRHPDAIPEHQLDNHAADMSSHQVSTMDILPQDSISASFTGLTRPLNHKERELLVHLDRLKFFLATAPSRWSTDPSTGLPASTVPSALPLGHPNSTHPALNRFLLPNSEYVSCVLWSGLYHITGTDIVRALVFRFEAFGRPVKNMKKFEEGVFSDLRNLKPGIDACLEEPKSPFLDLLFKYQCIRTQKKQKVFYWFSVPHDRLFLDALERDLKREKMGQEPTTVVVGEPALSFTYDPKRSLYEQFSKAQGAVDGESELETAVRRADEAMNASDGDDDTNQSSGHRRAGSSSHSHSDAEVSSSEVDEPGTDAKGKKPANAALNGPNSPFFSMFSLFEGSPTYKQRRKKITKNRRSPSALGQAVEDFTNMYSMRIVPSEPQIDRFGRDTTRMSAAEMFMASARGDFGPQSNPDLIATQKERQRRAMQEAGFSASAAAAAAASAGPSSSSVPIDNAAQTTNGLSFHSQSYQHGQIMPGGGDSTGVLGYQAPPARPHVEQRHSYPLVGYPGSSSHPVSRSNTDPFDPMQPTALPMGWTETTVVSEPIPIARTKAFVCPLFSCGRMFKRMEHLKRHLRTHTLERPYQCSQCKKRFSRSDNLNQHLRTHMRGGPGGNGGNGSGGEDDAGNADVESEDVEELEGDNRASSYLEGIGSINDVQMCEVEIQGQIQEVHGDEEGLVMPTASSSVSSSLASQQQDNGAVQELLYTDAANTSEPGSYLSESPGVQWATVRSQQHQHSSPMFTSTSMPSPQPHHAHHAHHPQQHSVNITPSSSYSSSSLDQYMSMSAPSHKATFDHAALYPPEIANSLAASSAPNGPGGPGPIRRHRSATPSVGRFDHPRRPFSAALSEHSSSGRGYHPYASSIPHSAESSPMHYNVSLDYDGSQPTAIPRGHSHSRSSSASMQVQESAAAGQVQAMMGLDVMDPNGMQYAQAPAQSVDQGVQGYTELYQRTDSPMQYNSSAMMNDGYYTQM